MGMENFKDFYQIRVMTEYCLQTGESPEMVIENWKNWFSSARDFAGRARRGVEDFLTPPSKKRHNPTSPPGTDDSGKPLISPEALGAETPASTSAKRAVDPTTGLPLYGKSELDNVSNSKARAEDIATRLKQGLQSALKEIIGNLKKDPQYQGGGGFFEKVERNLENYIDNNLLQRIKLGNKEKMPYKNFRRNQYGIGV